ncbi:MAG: zinc ribbon domain-containing protein [Methanobrevibacter sp.]|uniref:zinc ribbon domain-containing protein n=1 Tax=Methanobrevibacter sp. TaxID=66852 RepID=UPI001B579ED2|nr:zinc ribbon domain-containing protein [Methanobrevibacter sp.]MBP3791061.1 zinc ribbon domain-containing protein [Methanobrevibacter sp.]
MIRRCPQCGTASDDMYGFCIKCGHEFPKVAENENACPLCGFPNPDEADYCVKCGTPLIFKSQFEGTHNAMNPIVIKKEVVNNAQEYKANRTSKWLILFGYVFSILGGILGLIIAIYLSTRKDPVAKKHGHIQLAIFGFYILLIAILFATGHMPADAISQYQQMLSGNFTSI